MPIYTVHVPPHVDDEAARAERTAFVRDGFNGWAFLFGPLFLLRHRAWIALVAWILLAAAGVWLVALLHLPRQVDVALLLLLQLFLGLESHTIRQASLRRRGFDFAAVVAGAGRDDGERAFFHNHRAVDRGPVAPSTAPVAPRGSSSRDVIGMFPDAGGTRP